MSANGIVVVFPGSSRAFLATVVLRDGRYVTVMTQDEQTHTVWADQVRPATAREIRARQPA
jgi:hypothetical protein